MAKGRNSKLEIGNWEQADVAMGLYAMQAARLAEYQAAIDKALAQVRATCHREFELLGAEMGETEAALKQFADSRKSEFKAAPDGDGRSYGHAGITIGFRKLLDKVALPRGDARKEVSLEYLEQYRPEFVRRTPEFDLIALLAALKDGDSDLVKALAEHGITLKAGRDEFFLKVA
jgi:hypothetical protein